MKKKQDSPVINFGKIKRKIYLEDTNNDSRYTTKVVKSAKHKDNKYKKNFLNDEE